MCARLQHDHFAEVVRDIVSEAKFVEGNWIFWKLNDYMRLSTLNY